MEFSQLSYSVNLGYKKGYKKILHNVSGNFPRGKLVGILGPSGSGKTSLLNALTGYITENVAGGIYVNGTKRNLEAFKRTSCYISQESYLENLLTVNENLEIAADLKLGKLDRRRKQKIINDVLSTLSLGNSQDSRIGNLSGGERKRLSIALELVGNPSILFLDEPTTGLDSSTCQRCVEILKDLSIKGKTVICTIHQPSPSVFQMFDEIYILKSGMCVYQGKPEDLFGFLEDAGTPCPMFHNPADYVIELISGDYGEDKLEDMMRAANRNLQSTPDNSEDNKIIHCDNNNVYNRMGSERGFNQFRILLRGEYLKAKRNPCLTYLRLITSVTNSLALSSIFWQVGSDAAKVWFNYNAILGFVLHLMMPSLMLTILTFPNQILILKKETFNRWYSLKPYYAAITLIDLPISVIYCTISNVIVYYLTDQPHEWSRFFMFSFLGFLISIIARTMGLLVGAFCNQCHGTLFGSAICLPIMLLGGYGGRFRDIPPYLSWMSHFSYLKYGIEGMVGAVNGYNRTKLPCYADFCRYKYTDKFLEDMGIQGGRFWTDVIVLFIILVILKIATYIALKRKIQCVK